MDTNRTLAAMLRRHAYKTGTFVLASGQTAAEYLDVKNLLHRPLERNTLVRAVLTAFPPPPVDAVAGVATGGITLAAILADYLTALNNGRGREPPWQCFQLTVRPAAKAHGVGARVDGLDNLDAVTPPAAVALYEDVVTTGDSTAAAVRTLQALGLVVKSVTAVVDRQQGGLEALRAKFPGVEVNALFTLDQVRSAEELPCSTTSP